MSKLKVTEFTCATCNNILVCTYSCKREYNSKNNCNCIVCFGLDSKARDHIERGLYCFNHEFLKYLTEEERIEMTVDEL